MKNLCKGTLMMLALGLSAQATAELGEDLVCWDYSKSKLLLILGPELDVRPALTEGFYRESQASDQGPVWSKIPVRCLTDGETCAEPDILSGNRDTGFKFHLTGFLAIVSFMSSGVETPVQTLTCSWGDADPFL